MTQPLTINETIKFILSKLKINEPWLANYMGITHESLQKVILGNEGHSLTIDKLNFIYYVLIFIEKNFPEIPKEKYKEILINSTVVIDYDVYDGSVSLINLLVNDPFFKYWEYVVFDSINDYVNQQE